MKGLEFVWEIVSKNNLLSFRCKVYTLIFLISVKNFNQIITLQLNGKLVSYFQAIDKVVDFSHKTFHKDDFRQTNAQVL